MQRIKKVALVVILLGVIVAAGVFMLRWAGLGGPKRPHWLMREAVEKIDEKTLEVITLPRGEWEKLGHKNAPYPAPIKYKNPKTGEYTMVPTMTCASCGKKIPVPDYSKVPPGGAPLIMRIAKFRREYICPRCGKRAFK